MWSLSAHCPVRGKLRRSQEEEWPYLTELAFELTQHNNFFGGWKKPPNMLFHHCDNKVIYDKLFAQNNPPWGDPSPHPQLPLCLHKLPVVLEVPSVLLPFSHSLSIFAKPVMGKGQTVVATAMCWLRCRDRVGQISSCFFLYSGIE